MSEVLKNLKKVRPFLPQRYAKKLSESLDNVTYMEVRKAFAGQLTNEEKLTSILAGALKMAENIEKSRRRVKMKVQELTGKRTKR